MNDGQELILYRLDELRQDLAAVAADQVKLQESLVHLNITVERRVTTLESKATLRGAAAGAITSLMTAFGAIILWALRS